jgi:alpha-1,3-rhamnosyl/mannosyltransferase
MRVAFDTRSAADQHGLGRYSRCLLDALRETAGPGEEVLETQSPAAIALGRSADVLHTPWLEGAPLHSPCPMVVTVRGVASLKRRSEVLRRGLRGRLRNLAVQRAMCVIVPNRAVAADAAEHLGIERERIVVVPEAADPVMRTREESEIANVRRRRRLPPRYLLWVGGLEHPDPTRHVAELAACPRALPLVLVGATRPWAHELPDVILTGHVGDEELSAIYSGAQALLLPSEHDGFGLSAVEALACGTPVAAFDSAALREALQGRATFVAAGDMRALIAAAEGLRRPAPAPADWSWRDVAHASWEVYRRAGSEVRMQRTPARPRRRRTVPRRIDGLEPQ